MKLKIAIPAVTIALLAGVLSIWLSTDRDSPIEDSPAGPATPPERSNPLREPVLRPPDVFFPEDNDLSARSRVSPADVEEIRMRMLASIAEDFRTSVEADIERSVSPFNATAEWSEEYSRYREDPTWPTIPALPGVSGFEIQQCPRSRCLSDRLAEEPDDPAWARPMESRILEALPGLAGSGLSQVFVVCRQRTCGVLVPALGETAPPVDVFSMGSALANDLGFSNHSLAERDRFQAIFLTTREQSPEMWVQ